MLKQFTVYMISLLVVGVAYIFINTIAHLLTVTLHTLFLVSMALYCTYKVANRLLFK